MPYYIVWHGSAAELYKNRFPELEKRDKFGWNSAALRWQTSASFCPKFSRLDEA